jgi:Family of unknown function (DUF6445)
MSIGFLSIDDFYDDPYEVRKRALECEYLATKTSNAYPLGKAPFPGKMSKDFFYDSKVDLKVSKILGKNLVQYRGYDSGKFRISKITDTTNNLVHVDGIKDNLYAGVLYLNTPEQNNTIPGTILYRHTKSGKRSTTDRDQYKKIVQDREDIDLKYWTPELISYITWNRLIVYPANYFHGIGPLFGDTDNDARLVQVFYWESL